MTVEELIETLSDFPPYYEVSVVVDAVDEFTGPTEYRAPAEVARIEQTESRHSVVIRS